MSRHADCCCSAKFHFVHSAGSERGPSNWLALHSRSCFRSVLSISRAGGLLRRIAISLFSLACCNLGATHTKSTMSKGTNAARASTISSLVDGPRPARADGLIPTESGSQGKDLADSLEMYAGRAHPRLSVAQKIEHIRSSCPGDRTRAEIFFVAAGTPGMHLRSVRVAVHTPFTFLIFFTSVGATGLARLSCSNWWARESRDMTVPSGSSRASAISRYERS
jgi:hypothetical protein